MIDRIDHIVRNYRNVEATASWYERALDFQRETYSSAAAPGQRVALKFAQHKFNLRGGLEPGDDGLQTSLRHEAQIERARRINLAGPSAGIPGLAFPSSLARPRARVRSIP